MFGPTGVGKTAVAIALAERLRERGEDPVAVSADAMQVYAGPADPHRRGDAQPSSARLEHRLLGFVPITQTFSAGAYAERAHDEIDALLAQGRRPIVVGGTGLYLRAALAELDLRPPVDPAIRARWASDQRPLAELHAALPRRDARWASSRPTASASCARHELLAAGHEPPPPANAPSQLWTTAHPPPDAARRARDGPRGALRAHRRPHRRDARRPARARRSQRADAAGARPPRARRSASRSCSTATSRR